MKNANIRSNCGDGEGMILMDTFLVCALSVWSLSFNKPVTNETKFNEADRTFFAMLNAMGPVHVMDIDDHKKAWESEPGAFLLFPGQYEAWFWYRDHGFELFPMRWKGRWIVRKRIGASA